MIGDSLANLDGLVTFIGCLGLATPVIVSLVLGWMSFADWRARRRIMPRPPATTSSNVRVMPRGRPFDWLRDEEVDA